MIEQFKKLEADIAHGLKLFTLVGFVLGFVMGMGTAFLIAMTILKWHR